MMSLYISIHSPSKKCEKSPVDNAINILAMNAAIEKRSGRLPQGPALDVTFLLPGDNDVPPFEGMRMGGYTRENRTLFFESAVPEHIVRSKHALHYVAMTLQDVVDNAGVFFKSNRIAFDEARWHRAIAPLIKTASVLSK